MNSIPNKDTYLKILERRRKTLGNLPIRPKRKKTRLFIDNEYFSKGYTAQFPTSVLTIYAVLAKYANAEHQTCFPAIPTIMREGGIGNRNTIVKALKILEAYCIVNISHSRGRTSNLYTLLHTDAWKPINSINFDTITKKKCRPVTVSDQPP